MEDNNINEFSDKDLQEKLEDINKQIEESLKISNDRLNQKIKIATNELNQKIKEIKERNFRINYNISPIIRIYHDPKQEPELNYIINPILLILANLETITQFIFFGQIDEILEKVNGLVNENIIKYFKELMIQMRTPNVNPNYNQIHQYFKNKVQTNEKYLSQKPDFWFKEILIDLEFYIDLGKSNDIENIITNNFVFTLCEIEKCVNCNYKNKIPKDGEKIIDFTYNSEYEIGGEELNNVFNYLYFGESKPIQSKYCPKCNSDLSISKSFHKTGKYLIIHLNQKKAKKRLNFLQNLKIQNNSEEEKTYEYELISALSDINIDLNYKENMNKFSIFIKNYINNQCFKVIQGKPGNINEKFNEEISKHNPNILVYKKIEQK